MNISITGGDHGFIQFEEDFCYLKLNEFMGLLLGGLVFMNMVTFNFFLVQGPFLFTVIFRNSMPAGHYPVPLEWLSWLCGWKSLAWVIITNACICHACLTEVGDGHGYKIRLTINKTYPNYNLIWLIQNPCSIAYLRLKSLKTKAVNYWAWCTICSVFLQWHFLPFSL